MGQWFNTHWGNILSLDFFSRIKASDVNIAIIVNVVNLRKNDVVTLPHVLALKIMMSLV